LARIGCSVRQFAVRQFAVRQFAVSLPCVTVTPK
jgi:hypothetical protein